MGRTEVCRWVRSRWVLGLSLLTLQVAGGQAASPRVGEVLNGMRTLEEKVRNLPSWTVKYRQTRDITKDVPHGWMTAIPPRDCVFARRGELVLVSVQDAGAAEPELCFVWRDGLGVDKIRETIMIRAEANLGTWDAAYYPNASFLNIRSKREYVDPHTRKIQGQASPYESDPFALPPSIEKRAEKYRVRPEPEVAAGVPCVVLEQPGVDLLWIDAARGHLCLRRQVFQSAGGLLVEWRHEDVREWTPGLWLPARQTVDIYNNYTVTPPQVRGKRRMTEVNTVQEMSFGELPPSFFTVPLSNTSTARVADHVRGFEYEIRPKSRSAEAIVDEALAAVGVGTRLVPRGNVPFLLLPINALLLGVGLLIYQVLRLRQARPSRP